MLNINSNSAVIFDVKDNGKYITCNLSTSKKNSDGTYTNMSWKCKIVGANYEKAKELKDKDKIKINSGIVENKYDKEKGKTWLGVTIFDFEKK